MEINWEEVWQSFVNGCVDLAGRLVKALIILVIGILIIQLVTRVIFREKTKRKKKLDPTVRNFMRSVIKAILWCIVIVAIICALGVEVASIITVLAAAGAAIALALQGSLSNVASGFLLIILHPFALGDFVTVQGNDGTVIDVGICATTLRTPDNKHVIIPNSLVTSGAVTNYSREEFRRIDVDLAVAYGSDPEHVKDVIMNVLISHPDVLKEDPEKPPFVRLTAMEDSSLKITARAWATGTKFWPTKFDLIEQCHKALVDNKISIPFPQMDVHLMQK
ncbi:MAG: mechanosensitive ion channel family protein [Clostridia bacterium]|nr:mechanosensitive ion channel family protein [Clostridia bacterium]